MSSLSSRLGLVAVMASACGGLPYRPADLQLDIIAPVPTDAETLVVCTSTGGELVLGAGNGRVAFTGLAVGGTTQVFVDVYDANGTIVAYTAPELLGPDTLWTTTPLTVGEHSPCSGDGQPVLAGEASWLLGIRFDESADDALPAAAT